MKDNAKEEELAKFKLNRKSAFVNKTNGKENSMHEVLVYWTMFNHHC
jgi:hypothetical protein